MSDFKPRVFQLSVLFILLAACQKLSEQDIYKRPDWLPGKLYTTVSVQENLTLFTECLRLSGIDKTIDVSGSWSVFAPNDQAIRQFLTENNYSSISAIPADKLERIVKFHIIQNPWSLEQLQSLGAYGWKTEDNGNLNPHAFKRETMLKNSNEKYWIRRIDKKELIVLDSAKSNGYKRVFEQSRKYVPVFYDEYMQAKGITSNDFRFYFNRPYESGNVYFAGAKIIKADIIAENGFVHVIDRLVNPMSNADEMLDTEIPGESYKLFKEFVYWYFPEFEINNTATNSQQNIRQGGLIDTLWDLNYAALNFNLHSELIESVNQTLMSHNGMFVPTDDAFRVFIDGTLTKKSGFPHWTDHKSLPRDIAKIIISQNFMSSPIYPSSVLYNNIFKTEGRYNQKEEGIIRKEFCSNCTFIGLNTYTPDKVFSSVTAPVFCRPDYSIFRRAMQYSGAIDAIAKHKGPLYFFPIPDYALMADSTLILNWINLEDEIFNFQVFNRLTEKIEAVGSGTLRSWILNQAGVSVSVGTDGKEIIRTLGGKNIVWDHKNNTIQGAYPCTKGYKSNITATCNPFPLNEPVSNGSALSVGYWFNFTKD